MLQNTFLRWPKGIWKFEKILHWHLFGGSKQQPLTWKLLQGPTCENVLQFGNVCSENDHSCYLALRAELYATRQHCGVAILRKKKKQKTTNRHTRNHWKHWVRQEAYDISHQKDTHTYTGLEINFYFIFGNAAGLPDFNTQLTVKRLCIFPTLFKSLTSFDRFCR